MRIGFRLVDLPLLKQISRPNLISAKPFVLPLPIPSISVNKRYHMVEALVACQVPGYPDPLVEKTFAVHQLHAACRDVTKKSFDEGYAYINTHGGLILEKLGALEEEQKCHSKWMLTMEPLSETAIAIRLRFWHHFVKSIGNNVNSPDTISTTSSDQNDVPT